MRQNPLQLVALGVCLNGLLLSVVSGENTSAASGSLRWTPHRAAARPLVSRDVMPDEGSMHPDKKSVSTASPAKPSDSLAKPTGSELAPSLSNAVAKSQEVAASPQTESVSPVQTAPPATVSVPDTIPARDAKPSLQVVAKTPREDFATA